jgi:hypothetical protein
LAASFLYPYTAAAANSYSLIAGSEADSEGQSFSYIGAGVDHPVSSAYSLTGKVFAGYLKYNFDSDGKTLSAEMPIATPSIGLKYQKEGLALICSVGADFRKSSKETVTGGTETSSKTGAALQAEAYLWWPEKYSAELIANYSTIDSFFWMRGRVKKGVYVIGENTDIKVGAEAAGMGNSDFSAAQAGALVEFYNARANLSALFKAGVKNSSASNGAVYGGFEVFYGF